VLREYPTLSKGVALNLLKNSDDARAGKDAGCDIGGRAVPMSLAMTSPEGLGPDDIAVSLSDLPPLAQLEHMWRDLEVRADGSFFTSWSWISAWLVSYAVAARAQSMCRLLAARRGGRIVALGILCRADLPRFPVGRMKTVLLHQTGQADDAAAFIEYNGFLIDRAAPQAILNAMLAYIMYAPVFTKGDWAWRGFHLSGVGACLIAAVRASGLQYKSIRESDCSWVDLRGIPPEVDGYIAGLSANTRGQLRRSIRLAEQAGPLTLTSAGTLAEARAFICELQVLHQDTWRRRNGSLGAFSFPAFAGFAAALIAAGYETGAVDVLRLAASNVTVGILINFVYAGHVYAYQSGFAYGGDNRLKPGLMSHAFAIAHYRCRNLRGYHFMAGEGRYKESLSTATERLTWLVLERADVRSRVESALRAIKTRLGRKRGILE